MKPFITHDRCALNKITLKAFINRYKGQLIKHKKYGTTEPSVETAKIHFTRNRELCIK